MVWCHSIKKLRVANREQRLGGEGVREAKAKGRKNSEPHRKHSLNTGSGSRKVTFKSYCRIWGATQIYENAASRVKQTVPLWWSGVTPKTKGVKRLKIKCHAVLKCSESVFWEKWAWSRKGKETVAAEWGNCVFSEAACRNLNTPACPSVNVTSVWMRWWFPRSICEWQRATLK